VADAQADVVIIGGGHNGLVAACYLARAGLKPLVLERRETVGGCAITEEFYKGFRASVLAHATAPLLPHIFEDLELARHGLEFVKPAVRVLALNADGPALAVYDDTARAVQELEKVSAHDARAYAEFRESFKTIGRVLAPLLAMTPPSVDKPTKRELWNLSRLGLKFRGLGKRDAYRLLRYGPMAVADLAAEWFETESLRAVVAARGIYGALAGPGPPARVRRSSCRRRLTATRLRPPRSSKAARARSRTRWPKPPPRSARRFARALM